MDVDSNVFNMQACYVRAENKKKRESKDSDSKPVFVCHYITSKVVNIYSPCRNSDSYDILTCSSKRKIHHSFMIGDLWIILLKMLLQLQMADRIIIGMPSFITFFLVSLLSYLLYAYYFWFDFRWEEEMCINCLRCGLMTHMTKNPISMVTNACIYSRPSFKIAKVPLISLWVVCYSTCHLYDIYLVCHKVLAQKILCQLNNKMDYVDLMCLH